MDIYIEEKIFTILTLVALGLMILSDFLDRRK
jgi:hypothetical protein